MIRRTLLLLLAAATLHAEGATNPRLSALQIEIWPEYDRPQALLILKGELAPDAALPAAVTLRLPASSGGPSAVAYADTSGKLFNLPYQHEDAAGFVVVYLRTPERFFHVEFYDSLATDKPERQYRYVWQGDLAADRVSVLVKEPAAARNLSVQPSLDIAGVSPDSLNHRAAELGALKIGQQLPIEVRYTKSDPRPSTEIIGATASAAPAAPAAQPDPPPPIWPLALVAAGVVVLLGASAALVWRRRRIQPSGGRFCTKCGSATKAGDRFCANCGAALA
jgi:hypothetical protein